MFGTLRWRLTLRYGALAIVLLILFALIPLVFYVTGASGPRAEQTSQVRLAAENAERILREGGSPNEVVQKIRAPNLQVIVRGAGGKVLASTPGAGKPPDIGLSPDSYPAVLRNEGYFVTSLRTQGASGETSGKTIEVYAGVPVRDDPFVRRLVITQLIGLLAALGLMVGLGPTLAAAALKPLRRVNEVAGELREGRLESRVDLPALKSRKDEVGQVAASFDAMAESLEKLFAAERESKEGMRRFLADASHELRTPLTSVLGYLDVLEERGDADPAIRERAYAAMKEEGGRMARLVEDLLTLARLESRQEAHLAPTDLVELARGAVGSYPGRRIKISGEGPVVILAEPESLRRVISNLLSNAVKHTPPDSEIEVSVKRLEGEAILRVSDEGEGISGEDLPHVFARFYQAETSRFGEGTGLGLTIVREAVETLGGHVEVESAPGEGATFTVHLPLPDAP
ncbi:MAG: sensor histidine kinase [Rubrobacteraceae bacterium]